MVAFSFSCPVGSGSVPVTIAQIAEQIDYLRRHGRRRTRTGGGRRYRSRLGCIWGDQTDHRSSFLAADGQHPLASVDTANQPVHHHADILHLRDRAGWR